MIDIRIPVTTSKPALPLHDFTVDALWYIPQPWPKDWEWRYDFPDIWRDVRRTINRWGRAVWMQVGAKVGYRIQPELPSYEVITTYVPVNDIREAVEKLPLAQYAMREPIMVVVGAEEYHQLRKMERDFLGLRVDYSVGNGPNLFIFSVPVILSRLHSGMVILPDMTGGCRYQLIETSQRYGNRRRDEDPQMYMPRW